jgi:hypothetical protein
MHEQEQHEMRIERSHPSGAEEWYCPTCGRRFLMQWPPAYSKIVLQPGDEHAIHTGGKGGLSMGATSIDGGDSLAGEPLFDSLHSRDGAATDFVGDQVPAADDDESAAIELSEEMLKPWRTYIEDSQDGKF